MLAVHGKNNLKKKHAHMLMFMMKISVLAADYAFVCIWYVAGSPFLPIKKQKWILEYESSKAYYHPVNQSGTIQKVRYRKKGWNAKVCSNHWYLFLMSTGERGRPGLIHEEKPKFMIWAHVPPRCFQFTICCCNKYIVHPGALILFLLFPSIERMIEP